MLVLTGCRMVRRLPAAEPGREPDTTHEGAKLTQRTRWPWFGFWFGCVLLVFAVGSMGAGHGSYLPVSLFGAPLSLLPTIGFFAAPVWWAVIGWMLKTERRRGLTLLLAIHTGAIALVLWLGNPFEPGTEQWRHFADTQRAQAVWLWSGIVLYSAGLVVAWLSALKPGVSDARRARLAATIVKRRS